MFQVSYHFLVKKVIKYKKIKKHFIMLKTKQHKKVFDFEREVCLAECQEIRE
jgi:hypothetical protein